MTVNVKELVYEKFLELLNKKNIDKITVKDLAEACGISRQTFYYHFQDILDVVEYALLKLEEAIKKRTAAAKDLKEMLEILLDDTLEHQQIFEQLLHSKWQEETRNIVKDIVMSGMRSMMREKNWFPDMRESDMELANCFYTYAIAGVLIEYRDTEVYDSKKMAEDLYRLITGQVLGKEVHV
ncbi:MAG: TetR/AcrR family transcriptional regulator [Clostridiales bacterium]|nr:TetR/AcrR family transcriptional regulator [Clostridiales bacterium]